MREAFCQLNDPNRYCAPEHDRLIDSSARQNIWWILAADLGGGKWGRDAWCFDWLGDCGQGYTRQRRDRYGQTGFACHSPSTDIVGALCWHYSWPHRILSPPEHKRVKS